MGWSLSDMTLSVNLPPNLLMGLSVILALAASVATAAFAVSLAQWLAPWFARGKTLPMRTRRKRQPAPTGWSPLLSATVAIAVGIVLTIALAFVLVVRLVGLAPA
jgi:uncharacterized membrane-anchored protein